MSQRLNPTPKMENYLKMHILDVKLKLHILVKELFVLMSIVKHGESFRNVLSVYFRNLYDIWPKLDSFNSFFFSFSVLANDVFVSTAIQTKKKVNFMDQKISAMSLLSFETNYNFIT